MSITVEYLYIYGAVQYRGKNQPRFVNIQLSKNFALFNITQNWLEFSETCFPTVRKTFFTSGSFTFFRQ